MTHALLPHIPFGLNTQKHKNMKGFIKILLKATDVSVASFFASIVMPIHNFLVALSLLAVLNIFFGLAADRYRFKFNKAFRAFIYFGGYLLLILLVVLVAKLMAVEYETTKSVAAWITWVMLWFYGTNILKNWNKIQPENKVIEFLYWVLSFKIVEKINFLKEFQEKKER